MEPEVIPPPSSYQFDVAQYEEMHRAGILTEHDRVELLDGDLVVMSPIGFRHATVVARLNNLLAKQGGDRFFVSPQNPFWLDERSMPQPDLALAHAAVLTEERHLIPTDILLVIEVSDSSLAYDRRAKAPAYARQGVPELWIVDLTADRILVHRAPDRAEGLYREVLTVPPGGSVMPVLLPDLRITTADVFGPNRPGSTPSAG